MPKMTSGRIQSLNGKVTVKSEDTSTQAAAPEVSSGRTQSAIDEVVFIPVAAGEKGEKGDPGPKGDTGAKGDNGLAGAMGDVGPPGPAGPMGPPGLDGKDGLTGPQGPQGLQGPAGAAGTTGLQGPKGDTGDTGPAGPVGQQGIQGDTGPQGIPGVPGSGGESIDEPYRFYSSIFGYSSPQTSIDQSSITLHVDQIIRKPKRYQFDLYNFTTDNFNFFIENGSEGDVMDVIFVHSGDAINSMHYASNIIFPKDSDCQLSKKEVTGGEPDPYDPYGSYSSYNNYDYGYQQTEFRDRIHGVHADGLWYMEMKHNFVPVSSVSLGGGEPQSYGAIFSLPAILPDVDLSTTSGFWYRLELPSDTHLQIDTQLSRKSGDSNVNTAIVLFNSSGEIINHNDDHTDVSGNNNLTSIITTAGGEPLPAGVYWIYAGYYQFDHYNNWVIRDTSPAWDRSGTMVLRVSRLSSLTNVTVFQDTFSNMSMEDPIEDHVHDINDTKWAVVSSGGAVGVITNGKYIVRNNNNYQTTSSVSLSSDVVLNSTDPYHVRSRFVIPDTPGLDCTLLIKTVGSYSGFSDVEVGFSYEYAATTNTGRLIAFVRSDGITINRLDKLLGGSTGEPVLTLDEDHDLVFDVSVGKFTWNLDGVELISSNQYGWVPSDNQVSAVISHNISADPINTSIALREVRVVKGSWDGYLD